MKNTRAMYVLHFLMGISVWGCHSDMADGNQGLSSAAAQKEPVRAELVRLQKETGLTLASFYRSIESVIFADRALSHGKELLPVGSAGEGALSRDGTLIALGLVSSQGKNSLGIVREDGSSLREYPEITAPYGICWSYNKSKVAMSVQNLERGTTPPNDTLQILDVGSRMNQVVDERASVTSQCWSPDDKQLVYVADGSVRVYNVEQKQWRILAKGKEATWSGDGNWIAFLDDDAYYVIRPSGDQRKLLFKAKGALTGLWWSPDSRIVAYASRANFFEGSWKAIDVGVVRLRIRRLEDNSEDWVAELSDVHLPSYQWIKTNDLSKPPLSGVPHLGISD